MFPLIWWVNQTDQVWCDITKNINQYCSVTYDLDYWKYSQSSQQGCMWIFLCICWLVAFTHSPKRESNYWKFISVRYAKPISRSAFRSFVDSPEVCVLGQSCYHRGSRLQNYALPPTPYPEYAARTKVLYSSNDSSPTPSISPQLNPTTGSVPLNSAESLFTSKLKR